MMQETQGLLLAIYCLRQQVPAGRGFGSPGTIYRNGYREALGSLEELAFRCHGLSGDVLEVALKSLPRDLKSDAKAVRARV